MAHQGASSSSLSSSTRWWTYDVFLSFRGEDTRQNFTSHLLQALDQKKIYTYTDYILPRGEVISSELFKAIESSRISIVVLSTNYASSTWCLDELMKILECKKTKQQKVLPVFYDVDPTEVRHQRKVFGKALAKLKERFKDESKVERWKATLTEVAGLSGFTLGERTEPEFIQEIVQEVSKVVNPNYLYDVAKHPVGMESRVQDVHNELQRVGVNETRILGIYGIGGVGKTNLAKAIYNSFTDQFGYCCFLANVRETSKSEYGLIQLQETLLCQILGDSNCKVRNVDEGMGLIKQMLWSKRVLLLLDDLDQSVEVEKLLGGCGWYGLGSVIIITTRDERLLTINNVHLRYKVKELDRVEALRLFCLYAFKKENPNHDFAEITENVLNYVGGLPLALMVVGSDLFGRDIHYWRSALGKYKRIPPKDILETLRISYDGLDESEKSIFLDIACFFTGEKKEYVTKVLDGCGFFPKCGIKVLVDKSLITIVWDRLIMHDLLKDMGREIVRQESREEPEKRSRLWFHEDVRHVLEETKGTNKIEGILLDFPEDDDDMQIRLHPEAFMKMRNLRLFINRNAKFSAGPNYLSNKIRVLHWPNYPSSFLPSNFRGNNLVDFRMHNSLIKELGGLKHKNLTVLNLSGCKFLTKFPDLSSSPNLEELDLSNCENLVKVHDSVGFLEKLWTFSVSGCCKLRILPKRFKLISRRFLNLKFCSSLEDFPEIECETEFLLMLKRESLKNLRSSTGNLTRLEDLHATDCDLPSSIFQLQSLCSFEVVNFRQVEEDGIQVPIHIGKMEEDGIQVPIHIGKMEEDGTQSTPTVVSRGEESEIASTTAELTPTNSTIFNDAGSSSSAIWKSLQELILRCCCLSESKFFTNDPSEVQNLRGDFGEALAKHQESFKEDLKVQRWKKAIQEDASLAGEHSKDRNEYEFMHYPIGLESPIASIVKSTQLDIAEYPIGLESRLKDFNTILEVGRNDITLMIGIYGMGGIGKTTLAKAVFNSIGHQFEARCFLANVREKSIQMNSLEKLQEKILCELLGNSESFNIGRFGGTNVIKDRLCSKKVLLILDDVNELRQLKELAGNHDWFGPGSRIVITTRDRYLLTSHLVDRIYKVQGLDDNEAIQLFSWHAFARDKPVESYVELTKGIIGYAKGLPLALTVLGSDMRGRSTMQEWKSALEVYEKSPPKNIYVSLKISYDELEDNEKDIFLDIACFFNGRSVEYVMTILDNCDFFPYIGIARLEDKCLINIRHQCVEMHDLLQKMGKEIVRQESPKEASKRSRLWFHEDVRHVLEENTGTNKIEAILLDFPDDKQIHLHPKAFKKMKNLRLFINRNAQFSGGPPKFLPKIRVPDWPRYPWSVSWK